MSKERARAIKLVTFLEREKDNLKNFNDGEVTPQRLEAAEKEIEAFVRRIAVLVAKYNIEQSELEQVEPVESELGSILFIVPKSIYTDRNCPKWFSVLCAATAEIYNTKIVTHYKTECLIFGDSESSIASFEMLKFLCSTMIKFHQEIKKHLDIKRSEYFLGFAVACLHGANDKKNEITKSEQQSLMVIKDKLTTRIDALIKTISEESEFGATETKIEYKPESDGFKAGYHDGSNKDKIRLSSV